MTTALVPRWVLALAAVGAVFVVLPIAAMALRLDWSQLGPLVASAEARDALLLSLRTSVASTVLCVVLGVPMALVLARVRFPGQRMLRAVVLLPLVLPPVVGGIALLYTFGRRGLLGGAFEVLGVQIAFSTLAVVIAQTFVALPFLVLSLEGALRAIGVRYEEVAATLGARPTRVLRRITLPLALPALLSGTVLSFARALGEFGATLTFAGSLQGVTRTMPLEIYLQRELDPDAAIALSLLLVVVALAVVALAGRLDARASRLQSAPDRVGREAREREQQRQSAGWNTPEPVALTLEASVADRGWEVALAVAPGETVAVVGPNGAGKSTLLGLLAGGLRADSGRADVGGTVLFDGRTHLAPHERPVAILHQDPLLFPHLSVLENVEFGPRSRGMSKLEARAAACTWLAEADALELAERMPRSLSGGQAQRVAVARALAAEPAVLLLDEPLSSLDVAAAPGIRNMLGRVLADRTAVLVTHDVYDAHVLADRVVVLGSGRVAEVGRPAELFARPRTRFAAQLAGLELLQGRVRGGFFEVDGIALPAGGEADRAVWGALAPDAVRLEASAASVDLAVTMIEPRGDHVRVHLGPLAADVRPADAARLAVGDVVPVTVPAEALTLYGR